MAKKEPAPVELPDEYQPASLQPCKPTPQPRVTTYGCGYCESGLQSAAMFAGPSPSLQKILDTVPEEEDRKAALFRFNPDGSTDLLYEWSEPKRVWIRFKGVVSNV